MPMQTTPNIKPLQISAADLERLAYLRMIQPARSNMQPSSRGEKIADIVTEIVGSWRFIIIQSCLLTVWIVLNVISVIVHWDPYPFILLNLALSFQAAYATPFILMSQNRQSTIDRDKAQQDLDCDIKAEMEIELLHEKLDSLRDKEIAYLHTLVQAQSVTILRIEEMLGQQIAINDRSSKNT
jgi:uncharacterized membrane protein